MLPMNGHFNVFHRNGVGELERCGERQLKGLQRGGSVGAGNDTSLISSQKRGTNFELHFKAF